MESFWFIKAEERGGVYQWQEVGELHVILGFVAADRLNIGLVLPLATLRSVFAKQQCYEERGVS